LTLCGGGCGYADLLLRIVDASSKPEVCIAFALEQHPIVLGIQRAKFPRQGAPKLFLANSQQTQHSAGVRAIFERGKTYNMRSGGVKTSGGFDRQV
jgi:hypothetical protein